MKDNLKSRLKCSLSSVFHTIIDQIIFGDEPLEQLKPSYKKPDQKESFKEPSTKPNNRRYLTKEINEDDFFNKITTDLNNDLILDELGAEDFDQLETKNKMFATSNINHADIFGILLYLDNLLTSLQSQFDQTKTPSTAQTKKQR